MKKEKATPGSHFKMSKESKRIAAIKPDAHERGEWLRAMKTAEIAAEAFRRKSLKTREKTEDATG